MIYSLPLLAVVLLPSFSIAPSESTAEEQLLLFEEGVNDLYCDIDLEAAGLSEEAFRNALIGYYNLKAADKLNSQPIISIIDFTQSCNAKRFYAINLETRTIVLQELVAHGENSGQEFAKYFSNNIKSHQSSLGFFVTGETYNGRRGFSMKLDGMEYGFNSNVRERGVVVHGAEYVDESYLTAGGRIGRSWGCAAMDFDVYNQVIQVIKDRTCVFAWYPDKNYLKYTRLLDVSVAAEEFAEAKLVVEN